MKKVKHLSAFIECSSGVVPKVTTLKRYIHLISQMGYTELYLGMADAYKIKEEPYFNYKRGGYTTDDLREIDAYAKEHNVEVIAQIHTLCHLHFLKKYPEYTDIFDTDSILMVGEERVYELVDHMLKAISDGLSTRRIHIGMDEAFGLGTGRYFQKYGPADKKELLLAHIRRVVELAKKYNFTCEIWGDMLIETDNTKVTAEDVKAVLPEDVLAWQWGYRTCEKSRMKERIQDFKKHANHVGYAGAVWKHVGFAPNLNYSLAAILPQIDVCYENGIDHYMITMWADQAAPTSIYSCLPALYVAAEYANGTYNGRDNLDKEKFCRIVGVKYDDMYSLEYINYPYKNKCDTLSTSAFWVYFNDILMGNFDLFLDPDKAAKAYEILEQEYEALSDGEFGHLFRKSACLMKVLKIKVPLNQRLRNAYEKKDKAELKEIIAELKKLIRASEEFIEAFEEYYIQDNRGFGLEIHHIDFGSTVYRFKYAIRRIERFVKNDEKIEELEGGVLPINYDPPITIDNSFMLDYRMLFSYCVP